MIFKVNCCKCKLVSVIYNSSVSVTSSLIFNHFWFNVVNVVHLFFTVYLHPFNGPFSGTTQVSQYQKGKTSLDFTEARDSEWQWHQLALCKSAPHSRQTATPVSHHSVFLQAGCPSCHPANSTEGQDMIDMP